MVLDKPVDDDDDDSLTCRWWQAVEAGEAAEVQKLLETRPELIDSRRRVLEMATASARRVAALEVPPLMVVCDNGHSEVLRALLEAGAGACQPGALSSRTLPCSAATDRTPHLLLSPSCVCTLHCMTQRIQNEIL